jgi:hypothetical protein
MPTYYFHQHLNGLRILEDAIGLAFAGDKEACEHALHQIALALKESADPRRDTYLAIEISDGERTLGVIRGKVIMELYEAPQFSGVTRVPRRLSRRPLSQRPNGIRLSIVCKLKGQLRPKKRPRHAETCRSRPPLSAWGPRTGGIAT